MKKILILIVVIIVIIVTVVLVLTKYVTAPESIPVLPSLSTQQ